MAVADFSLDEILGQETAKIYLQSFLKDRSKIPGSLIFHGPPGVGKWSAAERFSRHLLCLIGTSCGVCEGCRLFSKKQNPDYIQFPRNKTIPIGSEKDPDEFTIRWLLQARIPYKPHVGDYRIILFPEANRIGNEAETTLLKTLEEPPPHTKFILITNDIRSLKPTIVSRSIAIPFQYLSQNTIKSLRREDMGSVKEYFGGSMNPFEIDDSNLEEWHSYVKENCHDAIHLFKLENWIRDQLTHIRNQKNKLSGIDFLDTIALLLLYEYRTTDFERHIKKVEAILDFKSKLHSEIPALEYVLLSQLFLRLAN